MTVAHKTQIDLESAMASGNPVVSLREMVATEIDEGVDRNALLAALDQYRIMFRDSGREYEENTVIEVMERLVGWCAPEARI
jgi:hypothetical protein